MSIWWWVAIFLGGLMLVAALGVIRRRNRTVGAEGRREGFGSFIYYLLIDWWIDWL
jgi:hypothetical protein